MVGPKYFLSKNIKSNGPKNFWVKKIFGSKKFWPPKFGSKSLVKRRSVTAEIMLIWTNVARTYVALANVAITVGIC